MELFTPVLLLAIATFLAIAFIKKGDGHSIYERCDPGPYHPDGVKPVLHDWSA